MEVITITLSEHRERPGRVKRCADYLASVEMKTYFMFLSLIFKPLNAFNTIFQTDATQIAILIKKSKGKFLYSAVKP